MPEELSKALIPAKNHSGLEWLAAWSRCWSRVSWRFLVGSSRTPPVGRVFFFFFLRANPPLPVSEQSIWWLRTLNRWWWTWRIALWTPARNLCRSSERYTTRLPLCDQTAPTIQHASKTKNRPLCSLYSCNHERLGSREPISFCERGAKSTPRLKFIKTKIPFKSERFTSLKF